MFVITYQDIHGSSAKEIAVKFDCSKKYPCTGIKLEDVNLTYHNQAAEASCTNAGGVASGLVQPTSCLHPYTARRELMVDDL
ncbi:hypothetical protein D5086_015506 [Populus alba]|uniref:Uncharacterized protein n=1 Tax=Populus alba TaxID=43335 RepID=A0ACC4BRD7_POPAL